MPPTPSGVTGTVYIFWDDDHDLEETVDKYRACVQSANTVGGCTVRSRVVEVGDTTAPGFKYWSTKATIEVVGVRDGEVVDRLRNPSVKCAAIHTMVSEMCS
ncbi:MAG: hypothetical protein WC815_20120 [Vicinamibacterales bacterium]|jgi:hypothetical protein